ncbi:MAG TPA: ATP-grasp domain-containing protein [Methanomicrobiales archaeon]|nr:ATP-grasp domain-containing protein [Methanomicrobiales archaeon]
MKVLLAEYASFHDPALAPEGAAMLGVLAGSFRRIGYEVVTPRPGDLDREIERLAPDCDAGLVIAPDHLLFGYTRLMEEHTRNLGCSSLVTAVCADKLHTEKILGRHGVPVPDGGEPGRRVVKPVSGCGSAGVRLSDERPKEGEFAQRFIEGDHLSASLVGSMNVGEACLYFTGRPPLLLALNRQLIEVEDGAFHYLGGETPVDHPRSEEIVAVARRAVTVLGCQGYAGVDMVVGDRVYVVDVNPRITTSIVGIAAVMEEEIAGILVDASHGGGPDEVHLRGRVRFTKDGQVTRL